MATSFDSQAREFMDQQIRQQMSEQQETTQEAQPEAPETPVEEKNDQNGIKNVQSLGTTSENTDISPETSEGESASTDQLEDALDNLINNTFGGDPKKIAKSYTESQKAYAKLQAERNQDRSKLTELESRFQQLDELLRTHPSLATRIEQAITGQYNESLNGASPEPYGKPEQSAQGKLNEASMPTEQALIQAGYMAPEDRDNLSTIEYQQKLLGAQLAYLQQDLPRQLAQRTLQEQQRIQQEHTQRQQLEQLKQQNNERFEKSFERAIEKYGLDFTSTHAQFFDDMSRAVKAFLDPEDNRLISNDAFERAAEYVLSKHNMLPQPKTTAPSPAQQPVGDTGLVNARSQQQQPKPNDPESRYNEQLRNRLQDELLRRNSSRKFIE